MALDGRDTMVAIGMNGEALPSEHGFPARLVTPGIYGFVGATKWLRKITLTTYAKETAYWTDRDWATDAPIKISSRIDTPQAFKTLKAGERRHRGRRLGPDPGHREGRGRHRRRPLAAGRARPERRRRLLAPVVLPLGGRPARAST